MKALVTRVEGIALAPGVLGPYLFEGDVFRLFRVGPLHFERDGSPSNLERWELREGAASSQNTTRESPAWMAIPAGASEVEVLERFGFTL